MQPKNPRAFPLGFKNLVGILITWDYDPFTPTMCIKLTITDIYGSRDVKNCSESAMVGNFIYLDDAIDCSNSFQFAAINEANVTGDPSETFQIDKDLCPKDPNVDPDSDDDSAFKGLMIGSLILAGILALVAGILAFRHFKSPKGIERYTAEYKRHSSVKPSGY